MGMAVSHGCRGALPLALEHLARVMLVETPHPLPRYLPPLRR